MQGYPQPPYSQQQQQPQQGYPPPRPPPPPPAPPQANAGPTPLARLPLQIGTTATWSAARSAVALFPGLAIVGGAIALGIQANSDSFDGNTIFWILFMMLPGVLLVVFASMHLISAVKTRASDLLLYPEGILVDGGRLHGQRIGWKELQPPYASIEDTTVKRLTLWRIFLFMLSLLNKRSRTIVSPVVPVQVWRLHVVQGGQRVLIAETDRPIERDSMNAAAASINAVVEGQKYVEQAPAVQQQILVCGACGGPAVPDDADFVPCKYCRAPVQVPPPLRHQAAGAKALAQSRTTTTQMIAKLRDQPRAAHSNVWLFFLTLFMFGAWPVGWGVIAYRVLDDGFQGQDALFLMLPLAAVLGGFFIARGRLADRGALQLLTLGFGALAPRRDGEPSRCRRCQGPLPDAGIGGVSHCAYCGAENIVGLDLRPSLDPARTEQHTFDDALKKRQKEKTLWTVLTFVAVIALFGWIAGTVFYVIGQDDDAPAPPTKAHVSTATTTASPTTTAPTAKPTTTHAPAPTHHR